MSEWLCEICWTKTKAFNEFYEEVETQQKSYWESMVNKADDIDIEDFHLSMSASESDPGNNGEVEKSILGEVTDANICPSRSDNSSSAALNGQMQTASDKNDASITERKCK